MLEGCLGFLFLAQQLGNLAQLRIQARRDHDASPAPIGGHGTLVGHVGAVPQRRIQFAKQDIHLFHRLGFPGQGRLLDLQARHIKQSQVSRNDIAGLQHDQIARHQLAGRYRVQLALAQYLRGGTRQSPERCDGALRPVFLHKADDRVQHHDDDDGDGIGDIPEQARNQAGHHQHDDHEVGELTEEHPQRAARPLLGNGIRAKDRPALQHIRLSQALLGIDLEPGRGLPGLQQMPGRHAETVRWRLLLL